MNIEAHIKRLHADIGRQGQAIGGIKKTMQDDRLFSRAVAARTDDNQGVIFYLAVCTLALGLCVIYAMIHPAI